eukprot:CAMPEP_0197569732 /NCGR_PEP_ID=MMETSP1320-20131121/39514_1 /TAXON_ID=91990 /ORGANISM="Bolidomonas sp., Strain RCC2347" /LENGTH=89 /DNA_ID=CAMNT_0043132115 /DNA_START=78 /DNA_END=344 /DNA_ORIENTATION=-
MSGTSTLNVTAQNTEVFLHSLVGAKEASFAVASGSVGIDSLRDTDVLRADLGDGSLTFGTSHDAYLTGEALAACLSAKTTVKDYGAQCS